jgi:hypothetical protein
MFLAASVNGRELVAAPPHKRPSYKPPTSVVGVLTANLSGNRQKEIEHRHGQQLVCVFAPKGRRITAQGGAGLPAKPWDAGEISLHKMPTGRVGIEDAPGGLVEVLTFLVQRLCLAKSQIDLGRPGQSPLCPSPPEGREETPVADSRSTQSLDCRRERAGRQRGGRTLRARGRC